MIRVRPLSSLTFLLPFVLAFGSFALSNALSVHLTQSFTPAGNILIRCSATGPLATQSVIRLGCTSDDIGICRENCSRPCITRNGVPDCSNKKPDGVVQCTYNAISKENIEVVYELAPDELTPDGQWWCNFRGRNSQKISSQSIKKVSPSTSTPTVLTSSTPENIPRFVMSTVNRNESVNTKPVFTPDIILIIVVGTIASTILNLILFIRCLSTRNYIKKIASGGRPNAQVEACLCIKKLAKTYRPPPRRPAKLSGSNISWPTQVRLAGGRQHVPPMSEPIKRRFAPVPNDRPPTGGFGRFSSPYLPGQGVPMPQFSGGPLLIEESLYDDVPPSSVYPSDGQSNRTAALDPTLTPGTRRTRKCIVDAEGTVYVAVGQVSKAHSMHSGLEESRSNLAPASPTPRTLRTSQSRLQQQQQQRSPSAARPPPPTRYLNGYAAASNGVYSPLLDPSGDPFRVSLGPNQSPLPRLPPAATPIGSSASAILPAGLTPSSMSMGTRSAGTRGQLSSAGISQSSNLNPPTAFDDQFSDDEEMDDLFGLATNGTTRPRKNP